MPRTSKKPPVITAALLKKYLAHLQERSRATVSKYAHDIGALCTYLNGAPITKAALIDWKAQLVAVLAPASVNSMLVAVNGFLQFCGWAELRVKLLKIQRSVFLSEEKELTRTEYERLVHAARQQENERPALVLQTICATGIRVSELKFITAECGIVHARQMERLELIIT